ncbi:MAG: hypothetical protein AB1546_07105 [bacterium]
MRYIFAIFVVLSAAIALIYAETGPKRNEISISDKLLENYLKMAEMLAKDSIDKLNVPAKELVRITDSYLKGAPIKGSASNFKESAKVINANAKILTTEKINIETARSAFAVISDELAWAFYKGHIGSKKDSYHIFYCPMADHYWLQKGTQVRNPFWGKRMLNCGSEVKEVTRKDKTSIKNKTEEYDPFAVVDAPPGERAISILKGLKCACCGKPLVPTTCGCAKKLAAEINNRISEMEDEGLTDEQIISRLRDKYGKGVVP